MALVGETGTDWVFQGTMRFAGDVLAQFYCGTALPERDELEVIGSEGSLFLDDPWHCRVPVIEVRRGGEVERVELELVDSTGSSSRTCRTRSAGKASCCSGARTRSLRRGRSRRCTTRP